MIILGYLLVVLVFGAIIGGILYAMKRVDSGDDWSLGNNTAIGQIVKWVWQRRSDRR